MIINGVIVVEGQQDKALLSSFISSEIVTLNGLEVSKDTIEYLKLRKVHTNIFILTDPDEAGEKIRIRVNESLSDCINIYINKDYTKGHIKHGVAECDINYLKDLLKEYETNDIVCSNISLNDLYQLGDFSKIKETLIKHYHLGHCSTKEMIKRLNYLNITIEQVKEIL